MHRNELGSDHPPSSVSFSDVSSQIGLNERQCEVRTSPNWLFPQYDNKLKRWDQGCFWWPEETLSGGACVGDADGDGIDDLYYPRLDGLILYIVDKHGNFKDQTNESNLFSPQMKSNGCHFLDIDNDGDNDLVIALGVSYYCIQQSSSGSWCIFIAFSLQTVTSSHLSELSHGESGASLITVTPSI